MFAYAYFVIDRQVAKVPVSYVKRFEKDRYNAENVYKVFWSRYIHSIQNEEDSESMEKLRNLGEPPLKANWNTAEGEGYYGAFILRVEGKCLCPMIEKN